MLRGVCPTKRQNAATSGKNAKARGSSREAISRKEMGVKNMIGECTILRNDTINTNHNHNILLIL